MIVLWREKSCSVQIFVQLGYGQNNVHDCVSVSVQKWERVNVAVTKSITIPQYIQVTTGPI